MSYVKKEEAKTLLEFAVTDKWSLEYARKRFELDLPSADVVERERGRWIPRCGGQIGFYCSVCGEKEERYQKNFCSNCGAEMENDNEEIY